MQKAKYAVLIILMLSTSVSATAQMITLHDTAVVYNAYLQGFIGFSLFIWLSHKLLTKLEHSKPITNALNK